MAVSLSEVIYIFLTFMSRAFYSWACAVHRLAKKGLWSHLSSICGRYLMKVILIDGQVISANLQNFRYKPLSGSAFDLDYEVSELG